MSSLSKFDVSLIPSYVGSDESHPVPFEGLWQKCGYSKKSDAVRRLKSELVEGFDFIQLKILKKGKGRPLVNFFLTKLAAENFESYSRMTKAGRVMPEYGVQASLARKLNGLCGVVTPVGIIDILTTTEVIEVKDADRWKSAVGQVLMYRNYYPSHVARIHLFGFAHSESKRIIEVNCLKVDVIVTWE